jgi:hypothetical protein
MFRRVLASLLLLTCIVALTARADDPEPQDKPKDQTQTPDQGKAALQEERLSKQYQTFETALLHLKQRLERSNRPEDRERAAVLNEAIKKSSEVNINAKFETLITLLRNNKAVTLTEITDAMDRSKMLADDIQTILSLLLSDNRDAQLKAEEQRIRELMKKLDAIIREQKVVRAMTEAGRSEKKALGKSQEGVTKKTEDLAKAMGGQQGQGKQGEGKQGQKGQQGQQGQQGQKGQQNQQQQGKKTPGKENVEQAVQKQKSAEENLQKEQRDKASNDQDKAIEQLEIARKRLEEILRQLREEEMQRLLANLQARCERMLALQIEVYEGTVRTEKAIFQNPDRRASRTEEQRSLQMSDREQEIVRQARAALEILENEGSAVAFPEAFAQVRDDAQHVARRLGKADVGNVTQTIEQDIIATLKEMIEALKKAQSQGKGGQSGQSGRPGPKSLIDILAELKMIRSMQIRVNNRTRTYARQYNGEQANDPDIQHELLDLATRQQKIFQITNDIAKGKNQ